MFEDMDSVKDENRDLVSIRKIFNATAPGNLNDQLLSRTVPFETEKIGPYLYPRGHHKGWSRGGKGSPLQAAIAAVAKRSSMPYIKFRPSPCVPRLKGVTWARL